MTEQRSQITNEAPLLSGGQSVSKTHQLLVFDKLAGTFSGVLLKIELCRSSSTISCEGEKTNLQAILPFEILINRVSESDLNFQELFHLYLKKGDW